MIRLSWYKGLNIEKILVKNKEELECANHPKSRFMQQLF